MYFDYPTLPHWEYKHVSVEHTLPDYLLETCSVLSHKLLPDLDTSKKYLHRAMLIASIRGYIYYLNNPQQYSNNTDNIAGYLMLSIIKSAAAIIKLDGTTIPKQYKTKNNIIKKYKERLVDDLHFYIISSGRYKEHLPLELTDDKVLINLWCTRNTIKQVPSNAPLYEGNIINRKGYLDIDIEKLVLLD